MESNGCAGNTNSVLNIVNGGIKYNRVSRLSIDKNERRVLVIYTGGTIGMMNTDDDMKLINKINFGRKVQLTIKEYQLAMNNASNEEPVSNTTTDP